MRRGEKTSNQTAVIAVDLQSDFTIAADGPLAVPGSGIDYIQAVSEAIRAFREAGWPIIATQDAHPPDHVSFADNHPEKEPLETVILPDGRSQTLWPVHCVQGSEGARVMIDGDLIDHPIAKGGRRDYESYSAFADDGGRATGLAGLLESLGARTLVVFGMAIDFCLGATVKDAQKAGYRIILIEELCLGISGEDSRDALRTMAEAGAVIIPRMDLTRVKQEIDRR